MLSGNVKFNGQLLYGLEHSKTAAKQKEITHQLRSEILWQRSGYYHRVTIYVEVTAWYTNSHDFT